MSEREKDNHICMHRCAHMLRQKKSEKSIQIQILRNISDAPAKNVSGILGYG